MLGAPARRTSFHAGALAFARGRGDAPHVRRPNAQVSWVCLGALVFLGCANVKTAATGGSGGATGAGGGAAGAGAAGGGAGGDAGRGGSGGFTPPPLPDASTSSADRPPDLGLDAQVFAHDATTLYVLDPRTKKVTMVGTFDCLTSGSMVDIAIDRNGNMIGSAAHANSMGRLAGLLMTIDSKTASCQILSHPDSAITSLTYVPAGTLLPGAEALVGYSEDMYLQIDPATGAVTQVGLLNTAASGSTHWVSSGDVVSIINGGTYLTVTGNTDNLGDRIVEVDPATGALKRIIGATGYKDILGLGYWAGVAYGFTLAGQLVQISLTDGTSTVIPIPDAPADLSFLGAGTTTAAPIVE
jgi:hypothetical protein